MNTGITLSMQQREQLTLSQKVVLVSVFPIVHARMVPCQRPRVLPFVRLVLRSTVNLKSYFQLRAFVGWTGRHTGTGRIDR